MRRVWLRNGIVGFGLLVTAGFLTRDVLFSNFLGSGQHADRELQKRRQELVAVRRDFRNVKKSEVSEAELKVASDRLATDEERIRRRCLQLAKENPGTKAELGALYWVAGEWPETVEGKYALDTLIEVSAAANLDHLGQTFDSIHATQEESMRPLIPVLLRRERENPNHPYAAKLLTEACLFLDPGDDVVAPDQFKEIADIIVERHATSPKLANFCELLGALDWSPPWAQPFESHLRRIIEVNNDRFVRCSAKIALASIVQESGESRQPEAAKLFEEFLAEFDGKVEYHAAEIEKMYRGRAERAIKVIRSHGLGRQAPETIGLDLNGKQMALTDYRGKVVLVSFWATWCYPCMKMIPYEKELLRRFDQNKFAIVGVNGDTDHEAAREAVEEHQIPWRSFQHSNDRQTQAIGRWSVPGFPTFYLLDSNGIVRRRWLGEPPLADLTATVERLIETQTVETNKPAQPSATREPNPISQIQYPKIDVAEDLLGVTGFVGKTYEAKGDVSKYVVFIPRNHDTGKPIPAILFLHGSGLQGTDGRRQLTGALAHAIHQQVNSFPFIVVFPQANEGDWQFESPNGRRAIAILDEVCSEYDIDESRVFLTGLSMGGEGTWSLAAAHPNRWAAIVPICGGGDPSIAERIKHIPCWCFHGDADRMIPPTCSREMVEAIRIAGGTPTYHEYPGIGHNCWDLAYARPGLYEWLLSQERP